MSNLSTREILENMFNGTTAIKNQNPRFGQKEYYYINPYLDKQSSPTDKDIAYVDSPDDPNPFLQQSGSTSGISNTTGATGLTGSSSLNTTPSLTNDTLSTGGIGLLNNSSMGNDTFTNQSTTDLFGTNADNSYLGTNTNNPFDTSSSNGLTSSFGVSSSTNLTTPFGASSMYGATNNDPFKTSSSLSPLSTNGLSTDNALSNTTDEPSWMVGYNKYASKPNNAFVQNTNNNQNRRSFIDGVSSSLKHDNKETPNNLFNPIDIEQIKNSKTEYTPNFLEKVMFDGNGRYLGLFMQGIANSPINIAKYPAKLLGIDLKPIESQSCDERFVEGLGEGLYQGAAFASVGPAVATNGYLGRAIQVMNRAKKNNHLDLAKKCEQSAPWYSRIANKTLNENPALVIPIYGLSSGAENALNPENPVASIATETGIKKIAIEGTKKVIPWIFKSI